MRDLKDFTLGEWLQLQPLQDGFKQLRNDLVQAAFIRRRPPEFERFLSDNASLKGRNLALIVAFEQPWVLDWLMRMAAKNLADATLVVCDNSRRPEPRIEIERLCRERGVPYVAVPQNRTRHVNRSHGMALSWIYHNVVRGLEPRRFGFFDHDLIPLQRVEFSALLGGQPFYGAPNPSRWGWSLWAGYCLYDYAAVKDLPLNFLYDFSRGLDTGGRNWMPLYRHHERGALRFGTRRNVTISDAGESRNMEIVDEKWLHLCGVSYNDNFRPSAKLFERIAQRTGAGASLKEIETGA